MSSEAQRRARAAEETVRVLKRKVIELTNGDRSPLHRQVEAARRREEENRRRRELAEVRASELTRYNEALEAEVKRRTQAMKTLLDNVTFGFFTVDRALVVQAEVTRSCSALFDTMAVSGRPLPELLRLGERAAEAYALATEQVFEDVLPEEVSLAQVPSRFSLPGGRVLRVEPSAIRDEEGRVASLLFTVSDVTALEAAQRESATHRALVSILRQKESFEAFLLETRSQAAAAKAALEQSDDLLARRVLHTLKGNAASYTLIDVVEAAHRVEEQPAVEPADIDRVLGSLRAFLRAHRAVLELDLDRPSEQPFQVTREQLAQLRAIAAEIDPGAAERLRRWASGVLARPASQLIGPLDGFSIKLAERLGKELDFTLEGGETLVDVETMRPVLLSLGHLVRNAIDHGIEPPNARGAKPRRGTLRVQIARREDGWQIEVEDDGRGVDLPRVRQRAVEQGVASIDHVTRLPDGGLSLIFVDGVSTAPVTTHISGRGVGMSAVRAAVEGAGGTVSVATTPGRGTRVRLVVPRRGEVGS